MKQPKGPYAVAILYRGALWSYLSEAFDDESLTNFVWPGRYPPRAFRTWGAAQRQCFRELDIRADDGITNREANDTSWCVLPISEVQARMVGGEMGGQDSV